MASLLKLSFISFAIHFIICSASDSHQYAQLRFSSVAHPSRSHSLSAISWGSQRMDVYANDGLSDDVSHKWWDGHQWGPSATKLETLGGNLSTAPTAVSWGKDRMDIFAASTKGALYHKYFDGHSWQPSNADFEKLAIGFDASYTLSACTWGPNRLDVFGIGPGKAVIHKYWDGYNWRPERSPENLDGYFTSGPSAVSWGPNRLDIFAVEASGYVQHKYWDGTRWVGWDYLGGPQFFDTPTATSWGPNRIDLFGVGVDGVVYHKTWDGSQWLEWEDMGQSFAGTVGVTSWSVNRLDVVALSESDGGYYYKNWDGTRWNPDLRGWYPKKGNFSSSPAVVSWGPNRLDIFGIDDKAALTHQTWWGEGWYPGPDEWESLGSPIKALEEPQTIETEL